MSTFWRSATYSEMINIVTPRCLCWSTLQVVVFIVCYRGKVSSETAQGCVDYQLSLECPETNVINVTAVVLGDSRCRGTTCCIKDDDCTRNANANHKSEVRRRCNGKRSCNVEVLKEKIPCGYFYNKWSTNDFERITYSCRDEPRIDPNNPTDEQDFTPDGRQDEDPTEEDESDGYSPVAPAVMVTVCVLVVVAIVVVIVVMRRKRRKHVTKAAVEMTHVDNNAQNEAIYANENQTTHLNPASSPIYSDPIKPKAGKNPDNCAKPSETYEIPNNAGVYSLAGDAGSTPPADPNVDSREPAYQVPRSRPDVYSVVRDVNDKEPSADDGNVYCDVVTREPAKTVNSAAANVYDKARNWNETEYKLMKKDETNPDKKTAFPSANRGPDSYSQVSKPPKNAATVDLKADFPGKADEVISTSDGFPSPTYETMSPGIPESIYANEPPALSPAAPSLAASAICGGGTEMENPYCEMQSPPVRFKDDGGQTVIDNDLYSH